MNLNRREVLKSSLALSGAALLGGRFRLQIGQLPELPNPSSSGIDHIVVVTMENRSFDHLMGWLPKADGKQAGLTFLDPQSVPYSTHQLSGDNTGCPHPDPDHSYSGARVEYNGGAMNGFLLDTSNDVFCIGYYGDQDIPFYANLARSYTTCDRYFVSILGPTFPKSPLFALGADRPPQRLHQPHFASHHLGSSRRRRCQRPLLLQQHSLRGALGHQVPRHHQEL